MTAYAFVLTFDADSFRVAYDLLKIIETTAPYMVDNVELEPVKVAEDNHYEVIGKIV